MEKFYDDLGDEMHISDLSDAQLATCVDEYMKRAVNRMRASEYTGKVLVQIWAWQWGRDDDYTIDHSIELNENYKMKGNNILLQIPILLARIEEDKQFSPTEVKLSLPAPTPVEEEYTEFEEPEHDYFPNVNIEEPI